MKNMRERSDTRQRIQTAVRALELGSRSQQRGAKVAQPETHEIERTASMLQAGCKSTPCLRFDEELLRSKNKVDFGAGVGMEELR